MIRLLRRTLNAFSVQTEGKIELVALVICRGNLTTIS